jgi:hypothetical protein
MGTLLFALLSFLRAGVPSRATLALENAALRSNSGFTRGVQKHPRLRSGHRVFWVLLRKLWSGWTRPLIVATPETVIAWHRQGFRLFCRRRSMSRKVGSRRIVHVNVTTNPTLPWVKQQIREAAAWGQTPRFLVHDNDGIFGQFGRRVTAEKDGRWTPCLRTKDGRGIPSTLLHPEPLHLRSQRLQPALDRFIAAVDVIDAVDARLSLRHQRGQNQAG